MKIDRHGKAAPLTPEQFEALLAAAPSSAYRALWAIQRWSAARINEALSLTWADVAGNQITYRRANTKTRATRQVPPGQSLQAELVAYRQAWIAIHGHAPKPSEVCCSRGRTPPPARSAGRPPTKPCVSCKRIGLSEVSRHSFRRTAAQDAVGRGLPLHVVQALTGHRSLGSLGEYLQASESELLDAIGA
ncbi:site-specific integrase [Synechococcus sp. BMK-MC-1]|uniref:tyrosine-type recombinase/integrase n=1 Tax=Synechococcus sp. BMK-MC-1 TaxID=1442551 RepID=UPI001646725F|nr:site-specific integrase [Synechococcus sp. BMK-MC-1]QNI68060.1 phage integrase [Synechococcus sp. BMK-MC-1]